MHILSLCFLTKIPLIKIINTFKKLKLTEAQNLEALQKYIFLFFFSCDCKNNRYSSYFMRYDHLCIRPFKHFLCKCNFDQRSYRFGYDRLQKMYNFLSENVCKSFRNKMEVTENSTVCIKTKISKSVDELFFTPMPTSVIHISRYIGLCDLFPVWLECITYFMYVPFLSFDYTVHEAVMLITPSSLQ